MSRTSILMLLLALCVFVAHHTSGQTPNNAAHFGEAKGVSPEERQALIALYEVTDGGHWKRSSGWLGAPGTECTWEGVQCEHKVGETTTVIDINLFENNLRGRVPEEMGHLMHLDSLYLFGNQLSGMLPDALIQRWRTGELFVAAETSLLTDVSSIDFESSATSLLCLQQRIVLNSDGSAKVFTKRCRNSSPKDRRTFCEVKTGRTGPMEFARLGWLLEKDGFFSLPNRFERDITDGMFESIRATRRGESYEVVDYAGAGSFNVWVIHRAIEGVSSSTDWEKTTTQPECPRWEQRQITVK